MPSPFFPHMDPYIEAQQLWSDFRSVFVNCWQELKEPDPDIAVNLADVFSTAYQRGQYERAIDDAAEIEAELESDDLQWAAEHASGS